VSFDVFVQGFQHGDAAPLPDGAAAFRAVFGPHVDRTEPQHHFVHLTTPDGGEASIYVDLESCDHLMLNHFSDGDVMDLLAEFARRTGAVIMPVGCPVLITAPDQLAHLPADLLDELPVAVITTGHDITEALRTA
jgi:hypothetical protein